RTPEWLSIPNRYRGHAWPWRRHDGWQSHLALSRRSKRGRCGDGDQRRLSVRRGALHGRWRPDERDGVALPRLPKIHWKRLRHAGSGGQGGDEYRGRTEDV